MIEEYRKYEYDDYGQPFDWLRFLIVLIMVLMGLGIFSSCKTKYVTVPEYHTEHIVKTDTFAKLDSVLIKDSVFVYHNGDTIFVNKVAYRDRYHNIYKVKLDTIIKRDSISVPVERTLTKSEQRLMTLGRLFIGFLFVVVAGMTIGIFWYRNKKC